METQLSLTSFLQLEKIKIRKDPSVTYTLDNCIHVVTVSGSKTVMTSVESQNLKNILNLKIKNIVPWKSVYTVIIDNIIISNEKPA